MRLGTETPRPSLRFSQTTRPSRTSTGWVLSASLHLNSTALEITTLHAPPLRSPRRSPQCASYTPRLTLRHFSCAVPCSVVAGGKQPPPRSGSQGPCRLRPGPRGGFDRHRHRERGALSTTACVSGTRALLCLLIPALERPPLWRRRRASLHFISPLGTATWTARECF